MGNNSAVSNAPKAGPDNLPGKCEQQEPLGQFASQLIFV
jgi:hypothetical protein